MIRCVQHIDNTLTRITVLEAAWRTRVGNVVVMSGNKSETSIWERVDPFANDHILISDRKVGLLMMTLKDKYS